MDVVEPWAAHLARPFDSALRVSGPGARGCGGMNGLTTPPIQSLKYMYELFSRLIRGLRLVSHVLAFVGLLALAVVVGCGGGEPSVSPTSTPVPTIAPTATLSPTQESTEAPTPIP